MKRAAILVAFSGMALTAFHVSATETVRTIAPPQYNSGTSGVLTEFDNRVSGESFCPTSSDSFVYCARYQALMSGSSVAALPTAYTSTYNASGNTGLGSLRSSQQRGPNGPDGYSSV